MDIIEVLKKLIQFNTIDGNSQDIKNCMQFIFNILTEKGYNPEIFSKNPDKPILYLRIKGKSSKALLLYGHIDVTSVEGQEWKYPPFDAVIEDGYLFGRGTIDMKGPIIMMLFALLKLKEQNTIPANDIIFILTSDEEIGGLEGCKYLVEERAELFKDVLYGITEFGGFSLTIEKRKYYLIQVTHKQSGIFKAIIKGSSKHTAIISFGETFNKLYRILKKFKNLTSPPVILPVVKKMFTEIAKHQKFPINIIFKLLINPLFTDFILNLFNKQMTHFKPLFYNSVILTNIQCIGPVYMIPEKIEIIVPYRLLPGVKPKEFLTQLRKHFKNDFEIEQFAGEEIKEEIDYTFFDTLKNIILKYDKNGIPIPILLPAATDARWFEQLGIQSYGFTPIITDRNFNFINYIHTVDEHIPLDVLETGVAAYYDLLIGN